MGTLAGEQPDSGIGPCGMANPTLSRMILGMRLRRHREARGFSSDDARRAIQATSADVTSLESGEGDVQLKDIVDLCELYGIWDHNERATLLNLALRSNVPGWWTPYRDVIPSWFERFLGLEQAARVIRCYAVQFVPALLQIPAYASDLVARMYGEAARGNARRLELRMQRQRILSQPDPPHLWVVVDEAALRRPVGGRSIMFRQLQHLADVCEMPRITLQILPLHKGGHPAAGGAITLLHRPQPELETVYLEQLASALYIIEPGHVEYYRHVLNLLATRDAAPPTKTPSILRRIIRDL